MSLLRLLIVVMAIPSPAFAACLISGQTIAGFLGADETNTYCFAATNGQTVTITMAAANFSLSYLQLRRPDGTILRSVTNELATIHALRLTNSGEFTVVSSGGGAAIDYSLTLILNPEENDGPIASGETRSGTLEYGEIHAYYFYANSNDIATIVLGTFVDPSWVELHGPTGAVLRSEDRLYTSTMTVRCALEGRYTIFCRSRSWWGAFAYNVTLIVHSAENNGPIQFGETKTGTLDYGDLDAYWFYGSAGRKLNIIMGNSPAWASIDLISKDGVMLASATNSPVGIAIVLTNSERFLILCRNWDGYPTPAQTFTYSLSMIQCPGTNAAYGDGGLIAPGQTNEAYIEPGDIDTFDFAADEGDTLTLGVTVGIDYAHTAVRAELYSDCALVAASDAAAPVIRLPCVARSGNYMLVCRAPNAVTEFAYTVYLQRTPKPAVPPNDPRPHLALWTCDASVYIRWLTNTPRYKLQSTDELPNGIWQDVVENPSVDGDTFSLSIDTSRGARFYRLIYP